MDSIAVSFMVYTFGVLILGVYSARYGRTTSTDFFLAGRGLGAWVAALSSSASAESGWVTLGLVGTAFSTGVGAFWIIPGTLLAFLFNWFVIAERLRRFSSERQLITIPDLLASHYHGLPAMLIRLASVLIIITMLTAYVAAQLNAAGKTFDATFGWTYTSGVLVGAGIVLAYTVTGGFRAVAWTDVVQALMMMGAVLVLPVVLMLHLGGLEVMWIRLESMATSSALADPFAGKVGMAFIGFLSVWLGVPLGYPGQPHILVRFMAIKDEAAVRRGSFIATLWVVLVFAGAVSLGVAARAVYGVLDDPEQALPIAAVDFLPGAVAGMMIAAVLAAICSTADSQLLVSASAISHDLYVRVFRKRPQEQNLARINRGAVMLIAAVATTVALAEVRTIFDFVLYAWAGLGAAFGPATILILLWRQTTAWGVLAGIVTGFATAIVWRETLHHTVYELVPAFTLAFIAVVTVSWLTQSSDQSR